MANRSGDKLLVEMRKQYALASEAVATLYDAARDDIRFVSVPGEQWSGRLKSQRGDRPTYEFPKLATHVRQVINEMRQGRPQGKVRGTEESDRALAEIMQGICRNIESLSNADRAYDIAYESAVEGGLGHWRIVTDYRDQDDFELDIFIKPIRNAFSVKWDPASIELDRSDARYCFVEDLISKSAFERQYPKAKLADFEADADASDWRDRDQVRVCEYFWKKAEKRELWALSSGAVVFADEAGITEDELAQMGAQVVKRREVDSHKVISRITNGHEWLTDECEWPTKHIPIVPVWGNIRNIDGEDRWHGMVRPNKDSQRLHNVHYTAAIEAVAKAPKAPFMVKMSWIKGLEKFWKNANSEDYPYLPVNDNAEQMPVRSAQAEIPAGLLQLAAMDNENIKASTGYHDASLGAQGNETSGRAINARKQQGAVSTFNYTDNLAYGIKRTYEILLDMIPRVYDTPRVVRVLGEDGGEKWKQLYQKVTDPQTGELVTLNDISMGKYDALVTVGPSYATQRMEAVEAYSALAGQIGGAFPPLSAILAYQTVKALDVPGSEEVDTALRRILVQQGLLPPEEGDEQPEPQQPNPADVAKAEKDGQQAKKYGAEAEAIEIGNMVAKSMIEGPPQMQEPDYGPPQDMQMMNPEQPPQGGFFMGDDQQFTG